MQLSYGTLKQATHLPPTSPLGIYVKLKAWDLTQVKRYIERKLSLQPEKVEALAEEYIRYLALALGTEGGDKLPISDRVDPFWHMHILHTCDYIAMSQAVIGSYIHHAPSTGLDRAKLKPRYDRTIALYQQYFGSVDQTLWPPMAMICCSSDACECSAQ